MEDTRFDLTLEHDRTGESIANICRKYGISRKTYYASERTGPPASREDGPKNRERKSHTTRSKRVTPEIEEITLVGT